MIKILKITSTFDLTTTDYKLFKHINMEDILIFDIETTGFSREHSKVMLIGYVELSNNKGYLTQLFCNSLSEEKDILNEFKIKINNYTYYMTYNGDAFDIPYLNARYKANSIDISIDRSRDIDMLKFTRKHAKELNLDNYKLKSVEKLLGIDRKDKISGKDSIDLYYAYLKSNSSEILDRILLHNYDDIKNMYPLLGLTNFVSTDKINDFLPKFVNLWGKKMVISTYNISDYIYITLNSFSEIEDSVLEEFNYSLISQNNTLTVKLPLLRIDLNNNKLYFFDIEKLSSVQFNELSNKEKIKFLISINGNIIENALENITYLIQK